MLGALLAPLKGWLLAAGGIALSIAIFLIRNSGADAERAKQAHADVKAEKIVRQARTEARTASDEEIDRRFEKWTRK